MTVFLWFLLFGPVAALALWGLSKNKKWGVLVAALAGSLMARRAAVAPGAGLKVFWLAMLGSFAAFAVSEKRKSQPQLLALEEAPEEEGLPPYNPEAMMELMRQTHAQQTKDQEAFRELYR